MIWEQKATEELTHRLTLPELLLSTVKVKVHIQALHKLCDGIFVGVGLLKDKNISNCYPAASLR